ncbi:MAG: diguanylate cyclase [Alteromonadaceae bacterium]|nr:MAG: diguanylate cyclase [Alteromonadaceae bacterium]
MTDDMADDGLMDFDDEIADAETDECESVWRVLMIDDEKDVHTATAFALRNTEIVGRPIEFLHATSGREAKRLLVETEDIAVILLDVVMETPNAGLDLVEVIRNELNIKDTRIILRTGQPNQAPEIEVIRDYDINDYKLKSELTQSKLFASLTTAIRSYQQIKTIEAGKESLGLIVSSCAELLTQKGINRFAEGVILHLSSLLSLTPEGLICVRCAADSKSEPLIIAAAGHYSGLIDHSLSDLLELDAKESLIQCIQTKTNIYLPFGIALYLGSKDRGDMACFVSSAAELSPVDEHLIELFCANITICADNLQLVDKLSNFAFVDGVAGLPNRNALVRKINSMKDHADLSSYSLSLVDVDHFSDLNTSLGQEYGDALLRAVSDRMKAAFSEPCVPANLHGDTFAVFGPSELVHEKSLLAPFVKSFTIDGQEQMISVTAGIVPMSETSGDAEEVLQDASIVLKTAKSKHRGEAVLFERDMLQAAQLRLSMLRRLRTSFDLNQLDIAFQPKLRLKDGTVCGFESLMRWRQDSGEYIAPEEFIPLAEQSGLILRLGDWILRESVSFIAQLHDQGWQNCHMSINISPVQLQRADFVSTLETVVSELGVAPKYIDLEITESLAIADLNATLVSLNKIKALGFSISLDDFGTGFSSLNHLQKMPIDYLKIDRTLIDSSDDNDGKDVVAMILGLASRMGMQVVAEGVETAEQDAMLKDLDCPIVQGFYYAGPMQKRQLLSWLVDNQARKA